MVMMKQHQLSCAETSNSNMDESFSIIDSSIQVAEGLVHALLGVKRRLSFSSSSNSDGGNFAPLSIQSCQWPLLQQECQTNLNKKRRLLKSKKTVKFSDKKCVHIVESADDIKGSLNERWYQEDEYQRIKDEYLRTLIAYTKANMQITELDESEHCLRGLETQISILILRMPYRNRQKKVVKSVLSLQQVQKSMKQQDSAALREMSLIVSKQDNLKAIKNASADCSLIRLCPRNIA
jgi:hypothetical protein